MTFDHSLVWRAIQREVESAGPIDRSMATLIDICLELVPNPHWNRFRGLPFARDAQALGSWLAGVLAKEPPAAPLNGLWFGLGEAATAGGGVVNSLRVGGSSNRTTPDPHLSWLSELNYRPRQGLVVLATLAALPTSGDPAIADIATEASWALPLAYAALAVRDSLASPELDGAGWAQFPVSVVVGYESGDLLVLGQYTAAGFVAKAHP